MSEQLLWENLREKTPRQMGSSARGRWSELVNEGETSAGAAVLESRLTRNGTGVWLLGGLVHYLVMFRHGRCLILADTLMSRVHLWRVIARGCTIAFRGGRL